MNRRYQRGTRALVGFTGGSRLARPPQRLPEPDIRPEPVVVSVSCPTLVHTHGNTCYALGTWDGGTKITLRQTNGFLATYTYPGFSFLYSYTLNSYLGVGSSSSIINMAVDDDGFAYVWAITSGNVNYRLWKLDLAAHTASIIFTSTVSTAGVLAGPSWNPYDGVLYEVADFGSGYYELETWTTSGTPGAVTDWTRTYGFTRGDMVSFTSDGGLWLDMEDAGAAGWPQPLRYDGTDTLYPVGTGDSPTVPVPRTSDSVWTNHGGGLILHADGTDEATDCPLFTADGTARVHCGLNGLVTFLYPTVGGSGVDVYEHTIP